MVNELKSSGVEPPQLATGERAALRSTLLAWYDAAQRDLPWRATRDPYAILVSETMLQQTRVEVVRDYFPRFIARFGDFKALAAADVDDVLALWSGLGYYRRARALHAAAQAVTADHAGRFPTERKSALALPGVGPYTAGAVLSIAFDKREPLVDGNVERVFSRLFSLVCEAGSRVLVKACWSVAEQLIADEERAGDWNQALMELGATICTPRAPQCETCPLAARCSARAAGRAEQLPLKKPRPEPIAVELELLYISSRERVLLEQRPDSGRMAGMWQLPTRENVADAAGPYLFAQEWPRSSSGKALIRPLAAALELGALSHSITRHRIRARLLRGELGAAKPSGDLRWVGAAELDQLGLTGMTKKALRIVRKSLGER